jgi:aryl-alcohol dehydrogenase-like predicted oxidoreductase
MMFGGPTDEAESIRIIHRALDEGINFIDTANVYNGGESERVVGKALGDRRGEAVLVTKVRGPMGDGPNDSGTSRYHILTEVENSLRRLDTDHIDLYLIHRTDPSTPIQETLEALDLLVGQGKVRYVGCSNFDAWQICEALWTSDRRNLASLCCVQPLYNMVNRNPELELFPFCQRFGVGVMAYSPLARGVLTGKYSRNQAFPEGSRAARGDRRIQETELRPESFDVALEVQSLAESHGCTPSQFALAWVIANPIVTAAVLGPRTMAQFEDNLGALGVEIRAEALDEIDRLVPPGTHTGASFDDPSRPVLGRPRN